MVSYFSLDFLKPHLLEVEHNVQNSSGVLISVFHSLLRSLLCLLVDQPLSVTQLLVFVQKVAETFPSSSNSSQFRFVSVIGDILVDAYWSVESQVVEQLNAFKTVLERQAGTSEAEGGKPPVASSDIVISLSERQKKAEIDKGTLHSLLQGLLVSILITWD